MARSNRCRAEARIRLRSSDPTRMIGELPSPLLSPGADERDGYVPNGV